MTGTGPPDDRTAASNETTRRGLLAATGFMMVTAGCSALPLGGNKSFDTPEAVVTAYLEHHPLATSMSPEKYVERARDWWHSSSQFFNGLEEAVSSPFGGESDDSVSTSVEITAVNASVRNLTTEQLLGLDPNVEVSGSLGDFAKEETALVDAKYRFDRGNNEESPEGTNFRENTIRYLTTVEDDEWQILTSE